MASRNEATVDSLLERTIDALTANDAGQLLHLLGIADGIEAPRQEQQRRLALSRGRLLRALLRETARNLRLLRRINGGEPRESYGRIRL